MTYKEYKMKFLEIFRNNTLIMRAKDEGGDEMGEIMQDKEI